MPVKLSVWKFLIEPVMYAKYVSVPNSFHVQIKKKHDILSLISRIRIVSQYYTHSSVDIVLK